MLLIHSVLRFWRRLIAPFNDYTSSIKGVSVKTSVRNIESVSSFQFFLFFIIAVVHMIYCIRHTKH